MPIIRSVSAQENETVEIAWRLSDGSIFHERHTVPPQATIDAVREKERESEDPQKSERK